jgi:hypothetical protein
VSVLGTLTVRLDVYWSCEDAATFEISVGVSIFIYDYDVIIIIYIIIKNNYRVYLLSISLIISTI